MSISRLGTIVVPLVLGVVLSSCGGDGPPTTPSLQQPRASVTRLEIVAPASLGPNASASLKVTAIKSDGTSEDATAKAEFASSNPRVLQVSPGGGVVAFGPGEANVNARYQSISAAARIFVLPDGTYRLSGRVFEDGFPLEGATVAVIRGMGEGLAAATNNDGAYAIYGVSGPVTLHAKKEGYINRIEQVQVEAHHELSFDMTPASPRPPLAGTYRLTVTVAPCTSGRPPEGVVSRSYIAVVEENGTKLLVRLGDAEFIITDGEGSHFEGVAGPGSGVTFTLTQAYYNYYGRDFGHYSIVERLSPTTALILEGTVVATNSASGIFGVLKGSVGVGNQSRAPFSPMRCQSEKHGFRMERQ